MDTKAPEISKATPPVDTGVPAPEPQAANAPRRGRGRPFKARNTTAAPLTENPVGTENADTAAAEGETRQTRGPRKQKIDAGALAKSLKGIHALAAKMVPIKMPDGTFLMELSDTEATELANALAGVAKEYDLEMSGKTGSAITLIGVAAMIYGPKIMVIQAMRTMFKNQKDAQDAAAHREDASVVSNIPAGVNGHNAATAN